MASFLAAFRTTADKVADSAALPSDASGIDARALQDRLAAALDPDSGLLALHRRYREARSELHKVLAGRADSENEVREILGRRDFILKEMARTRARTLRGLAIKMEALRNCGCTALEEAGRDAPDLLMLQSILADSYWLLEESSDAPEGGHGRAAGMAADNRSAGSGATEAIG